MTIIVIYATSTVGVLPAPVFLKDADIEAHDGRGSATWTVDRAEAKQFADFIAAFEFWRAQSTKRPLREDGEPNRPLTAFTCSFED